MVLESSASDSSSNSDSSSELSKSSDETRMQIPSTTLRNEDDITSSGEDQPSPKRHKGQGGIVSNVKKM